MKVLLVEDDKATRLATAALASSLGHQVEAVESAEQAMAVLERGGVELLFTDLVLPRKSGLDLTRWVRAREKDSHLYVLLLTAKDGTQAMDEAFAAGVDDFVTKGSIRTEIASRFRVAERIVRIERHLRQRAQELQTALRRLDISAAMRGKTVPSGSAASAAAPAANAKELLSDLRAWNGSEATLKSVLGENVHQEFVSVEPISAFSPDSLASRITLTDVEHKVQIEILLLASKASAFSIAASIFGDPSVCDDATVADTMLELANGTMGAFKTAFQIEDYKFTPGIPKSVKAGPVDEMLRTAKDRRVFSFNAGDAILTVLLGVREKQNQKVKARALRDGMVLAEPVYLKSGALLCKAGTRLSEVMIERFVQVDPNMVVELSDPTGD